METNAAEQPVPSSGRRRKRETSDEWLRIETDRPVGKMDEVEGYNRYDHLSIRLYCYIDNYGLTKER